MTTADRLRPGARVRVLCWPEFEAEVIGTARGGRLVVRWEEGEWTYPARDLQPVDARKSEGADG